MSQSGQLEGWQKRILSELQPALVTVEGTHRPHTGERILMAALNRRDALRAGVLTTVIAGGVLAAASSASAAETESTVSFPNGTLFKGTVPLNDGIGSTVNLAFSFEMAGDTVPNFDRLDIARVLSEYVQSKGYAAVTFYGTPEAAALNP